MITQNPFKENGTLKPKFSFYNGSIWFAGGNGGIDLPAFKTKSKEWTVDACPQIAKRLKLKGITIREMSDKTGLSKATIERMMVGSYRITQKNINILEEIEATLKDI